MKFRLEDLGWLGDVASLAVSAVPLIAKITKTHTDDRAVEAMSLIRGIVATIGGVAAGAVTPQAARDAMSALHTKLDGQDARHDTDADNVRR